MLSVAAGSIAKLLSFVTMVIQLVLGMSWILVGGIGVVLVAPLCTILAPPLTLIGVGKDSLPMALVLKHSALITLALVGIVINVETSPGVEALRGKPALCMFSHCSNLDAFIMFASSPLAFIGVGKRSTFFMPIIGRAHARPRQSEWRARATPLACECEFQCEEAPRLRRTPLPCARARLTHTRCAADGSVWSRASCRSTAPSATKR